MAEVVETPVVTDTPRKKKRNERKTESAKKRRLSNHVTGTNCFCTRLKCFEATTEDDREQLIGVFNEYPSKDSQDSYLATLIEVSSVVRRRVNQGISDQKRDRTLSANYFVLVKRDCSFTKVHVCAKAFCSIFGITKNRLETIRKSLHQNGRPPTDGRGKHDNRPHKLTDETTEAVRCHISSFKGRLSHYTRNKTRRLYLPEELNVTKMHAMFMIKHPDIKVSYETYRSIFNGSFNIGFGYPRKDTCSKCDSFISRLAHIDNQLTQTTLTETEKLDLNREKATIGTEKELHHRKSETFYSRKTDAKARAKTCDEFEAITFDFAKNLPVPNKTCNDVYYKRQLSLYTFNIHVLSTDDVFLYTYDETVAKKGSDDVASMLMDFFINKLSNDVREVSLFCDGCSGQNKNYTIIRLLHHLVHHVKRFRSVKLSFPIRGHSYLECDRDFANVNFKKDLELPDEWRKEFVETRKKPSPFNVINATQGMFYSYAEFLFPFYKPTNPIKVRAVREFFFADTEPSLSHLVKHRDTWNGGYSSTSIVKIQRGNRASTRPSPAPRTSYSAPLPITLGKYKDLQILKEQCRPSNHAFFDDLPHHGQSTAVSTFVRDSDDDTPLVSDDESDD